MINFLSSYNSDNEEEEEEEHKQVKSEENGKKKQEDEEEGSEDESPIHPNSILLRHTHRTAASLAAKMEVKAPSSVEPEPLELLPESPEFELHRRSDDEEAREEEGEEEERESMGSRGHESLPPPVEKRSLPTSSAASSSRSHSSSGHEPPEKRPAFESEIEEVASAAWSKGGDSDQNEEASSLARSMIGKLHDEILLPPEPPGQCSRQLQERIIDLLAYTKRTGRSFVETAERSKSFRNPSIYEKLVEYCKIDENGTNFPPEIYNPKGIWGKESFYEELNKVQRQDMERREKERGQRPQGGGLTGQPVISSAAGVLGLGGSGLAGVSSMQLGNLDERERKKSKWDAHPSSRPVVQVLTGTAKLIPATGALGPAFSSSSSSLAANKHH